MTTKQKRTRQPRSSTDPATQYARDVVDGKVIAGPHVRAQCARHLRDLETGHERGLVWSPESAERFYLFCLHVLRLNGGEFEGKPFDLHVSQKFIAGSLFGWLRIDGARRFRLAFIEQGKGNGKSPLAAAIGLYGLTADNEARAEVYASATKKDQAQILFRDAVAMVDQSPHLAANLTKSGRNPVWNLAYLKTGSFFRPLAADNAQSGPRPHVALLDEVHEHKTGLMVEMMRAGTKGRRQALIFLITNSGTDKQSICWHYHEYATRVADGTLEDDSFFSYVCALDEKDDPFSDEDCWFKANPLLGVTIPKRYIQEQVREAIGMPGKESIVRRLNFCQWTDAESPWIGGEVWMGAKDSDFNDELLLDRKCYGGLDLSSTTDLTAFALLFEPTEKDPHWRQKVWFWLPADKMDERERRDRVPYAAWRAAGWLETTPGSAIDKRFVLARVVQTASRYRMTSVGYDLWRFEDFSALVADEGAELPLEGFGQGFKSMAPAVDEYERMLVSGELRHDGNPVMTWNAASAVLDTDPAGNRKVTKRRATGRVDGIVAAVMAAGMSLKSAPEKQYQVMFF
jgi:phage terminase large subunit-like protein